MPGVKIITRFDEELVPVVRNKAIEIANAILEDGNTTEGIAIATGIKRAKDWVKSHRDTAAIFRRKR